MANQPQPTVRQYAEPKFIPLQPGQISTGEANEYDAYTNQSILQPIPPPRAGASLIMNLADVIGQDASDAIQQAGMLVFHSVGDTGSDKKYRVVDEADVSKMMVQDLFLKPASSFFYHLGDVVYEFGQPQDYYAQFYEPFCAYNAPIFAIPGNHDGMIWDPSMTSLQAFQNNFCTAAPAPAPNAAGLIRSTMNQPGVYFTLEAPFVSIIGLYSNVSDKGPGCISSEGGKNNLTDDQKNFLIAELKRLMPLRTANQRAVIVAVHHPPFTSNNEKNPMNDDLDDAFNKGGLWPDVVLSGHAHLYERYERDINGIKMPYIVAGCGGYNLSPYEPASNPGKLVPPALAGNTALRAYIKSFGYLKIKVTSNKLAIIFNCIDPAYGPASDSILIDLATHVVTEGISGREPL
ncbi:MAG TPA: metallophosphoesterase [Mucilaginibacter sp.]|jgi:predicted phosphodiesterase